MEVVLWFLLVIAAWIFAGGVFLLAATAWCWVSWQIRVYTDNEKSRVRMEQEGKAMAQTLVEELKAKMKTTTDKHVPQEPPLKPVF